MRQTVTLSVLALGLCLAGCSSTGGSTAGSGTSNTTGGTHTTGGFVTAKATIIGTFRIQGGPAPGINRPLSGTIEIHADSATGRVVTTATALAGHFTTTVPPGRYVAVGRSNRVSGVGCTSGTAQAAAPQHPVHLAVNCDVP